MYELSLISLLIIVSVIVFINRIFTRIKRQQQFIYKLMTKIGTFYFIFIFVMYLNFFLKPLELWFFSFSSLLFIPITILLVTKFHQQQFYGEFVRFLSLVIIRMQMGCAFRTAYEATLEEESWRQKSLLSYIYEDVTFTQQEALPKYGSFSSFIARVITELRGVESYPHQSIDRLCNFREQLHQERFFRRKSRQIWSNFAFQFGILSIIYWLLFGYICIQHGFFKYLYVFLLSLLFYFFGFLTLIFLMRSKKWRI